jgi:hypothetical protein
MNYHAKCEILKNCYSCFAHHVEGLNTVVGITSLLKNDSLTLSNPDVASLVEARTPNTPISSVIDPTSSTSTKVSVRLL